MERTMLILKPDAVNRCLIGELLTRFEKKGLKVVGMKMERLTEEKLEVHYAHGSHTANVTTGDIGLEVSAAFMVDKGERKPVKGFMLSGNVFDWFKEIEGLEKKQKTYGSLISPRIAFRDVHVVA